MAGIYQFPTLTPTNCLPNFIEPAVSVLEYEDGAMDFNLDGKCALRTWDLDFSFLTEAEAAQLDAHHETALGSDGEFLFVDPYTSIGYNGVRYALEDGYAAERHPKKWAPIRRIRLVQEVV